MVLVDTSVWVDVFNERTTLQTESLSEAAREQRVLIGDLVLTELLQGARTDRSFQTIRFTLADFQSVSLCGPDIAIRAAGNYRLLRQRGITVRGTIDVIIATWCIENDVAIIHNDRDMRIMEEQLGLRAYA